MSAELDSKGLAEATLAVHFEADDANAEVLASAAIRAYLTASGLQAKLDEVTRFAIGDQVEKFTGDYQLSGEVRAVFTTKAGKVRYVVEHEPGFLHIYGPANIRALQAKEGKDG